MDTRRRRALIESFEPRIMYSAGPGPAGLAAAVLTAAEVQVDGGEALQGAGSELVFIDGNRCPRLPMEARAVVKGDSLVAAISAASILAKVTRDAEMTELDSRHPEYGFARHKGYPTAEHLAILAERGPLPEYRQSFKPVRRALGIE